MQHPTRRCVDSAAADDSSEKTNRKGHGPEVKSHAFVFQSALIGPAVDHFSFHDPTSLEHVSKLDSFCGYTATVVAWVAWQAV